MKFHGILTAAACLATAVSVSATPTVIVDNTAGIAVGVGVGSESGVNAGFGDVVGASSTLYWDSDTSGNLALGFFGGASAMNDTLVLYIDSRPGGFADTTLLNDNLDGLRGAISGDGTGGDASDMFFAPGFQADFAIAINQFFAGVFDLSTGTGGAGSLGFVASANGTPLGTGQTQDMSLLLSDIGVAPGGSFDYVGTYLNDGNAYRSNEGFGHLGAFPNNDGNGNPGNIGSFGAPASDVVLGAGEFSTFTSVVPEPSSMALIGLGMIGLAARRRRKA